MRSDAVGKKEQEIDRNFYNREDISTCVPNKKSVRGDRKARYILQRTLTRTFHLFMEEYSEIPIGKTSFIKLKPKNVLIQSKARWNQCLCEVCTNVDLKLKRLNIELRSAGFQIITDRYCLSDETICKDSSVACIDRKCPKCGVHAIDKKMEDFLTANGLKQLSWKQWGQVEYAPKKKRVCLQTKTGSLKELVTCLKSELDSLPCHLFEAHRQQKQFATVSQSPPPFTVVTVMDFAENFTCTMQSEVQSAHWYQQQVTLHPSVSYYPCHDSECTNEKPVREAVHIVSSDTKHDVHAVAKFTEVISEHIKQRDPTLKNMIQLSDGCAGQYKSRVAFADLSFASSDLPFEQVQQNYFGSCHSKNPCDGEGGVVKNAATRAIKSGTAVISDSDKNLSKEAKVKEILP
ncbi:uncharacterized protein [Diadema antillarum]|uniref:uncharacterized protein n=1 Tax=Diadema antillarum TaxID=105358 RepID=UPI003A8BB503